MNEIPGFPTFDDFFAALHDGLAPYPWQRRLHETVAEKGWPDSINIPTGLGKTAAISVWLYALAWEAHYGLTRTTPMRLFYVVNRRLVVDQGARYVKRLEAAIFDEDNPAHTILEPVRSALGSLLPPGDERLLVSATIHGQALDDGSWMRVSGATIISLTPAQLVSRVLMRGYGVSAGTRPIHAALTGLDRLILFDEPHLAIPAINALLDQESIQSATGTIGVPLGKTVLLGATVPVLNAQKTTEFSFDVEENLASPEGRKRLEAKKTLQILPLSSTSDTALANESYKFVRDSLASGTSRILVVFNTVAAAQEAFVKINAGIGKMKNPPPVRLLTARFRSLDKPGSDLDAGPLILVSTQTVEVGVDLSFDVLLTEACSFDALVQRLGRLNRSGQLSNSRAVLLAQGKEGFTVSKSTAHIYGESQVSGALELLDSAKSENGTIDVSALALIAMRQSAPDGELEVSPSRSGTLHSGLVPIMVQTRPTPKPDIPVEAFVSGPDNLTVRDVLVAWRDELDSLNAVEESLCASPLAGEYVSVPLGQLFQFLSGKRPPATNSDLASETHSSDRIQPFDSGVANHLRVINPGETQWHSVEHPRSIVPGARVVISSDLGGYRTQLGWYAKSVDRVPTVQLAALKRELANDEATLKLREPGTYWLAVTPNLVSEVTNGSSLAQKISNVLSTLDQYNFAQLDPDDDALSVLAGDLTVAANELVLELTDGKGQMRTQEEIVSQSYPWGLRLRVALLGYQSPGLEHVQIVLNEHLAQVGDWAGQTAERLGLGKWAVDAVRAAGHEHDIGKAWGPFQEYLRADSPAGGLGAQRPIAKSFSSAGDRRVSGGLVSDRLNKQRLGIPAYWRHEAYSAMQVDETQDEGALIKHLVGSHHGWFRPGFLPAGDTAVQPRMSPGMIDPREELGFSHAEDFLDLNARLGPWGLAYLEAIVRLADWTASASPQKLSATPDITFETVVAGPSSDTRADSHLLYGLKEQPVLGWYVAVGLLAAAQSLGDTDARISWLNESKLPMVAPGLPVLQSKVPLDELVQNVHRSAQWEQAENILDEFGCLAFSIRGQKMGPASQLGRVIRLAEQEEVQVVLGSVSDLASADTAGRIPLAGPVYANNTSYLMAVSELVKSGRKGEESALAALLDPNAGFSVSASDGGLDRDESFEPITNGREGKDARLVRTALSAIAFFGITSLGTVPPSGLGVNGDLLTLPLPERPTSLAEIRALTLAGLQRPAADWAGISCEWVLHGKRLYRSSSKMSSWSVKPQLRRELRFTLSSGQGARSDGEVSKF